MLSTVVVGFAALRRPVGTTVTTTTTRRHRHRVVSTAGIDRRRTDRRGNGVSTRQGKELSIHLTVHSRRMATTTRMAASPRGMNGYSSSSYNGGDGGYDAYTASSSGSRRRGYDDDEEDYEQRRGKASRGYSEAKTTMNRDEAMFRAMGGIFATACGVLRWGLPLTGGLACWAAAAANTGEGLLSALSGSLLVGTTLGVCVLIFAAASATMSGASLLWMMAKKYFVRGSGVAAASGRSRRRNGGMYYEDQEEAPRRRRSPLQSRRDDDDDDERQKPHTRVSKSFSFSDWTPEVPIVDPRAPGKWGGRQGVQGGDAYAWGTHKTPADFRREMRDEVNRRQSPKTSRDDDDYPSTGPSEWQSRAAYRAKDNGMMSSNAGGGDVGATPSRFGVAVVDDPRETLLKKFEPRERLLPRTPPKPKHAHIPTEVLIAMGGASLETHIGRNAKDILKTNKSSRSARLNNDASRRGASTAVRLFGFGSGDAPRKSKDNDVVPRPPSNSRPSRESPSSSSSSRLEPADEDWQDEIARRARERFERNLSSTFDLGDGFIDDDDDDDDDPMDRLRRTR